MVRKHNVLAAIGLSLALGAGTFMGVKQYQFKKRQKEYTALVKKEAAELKLCPDKLEAGWGSCLVHEQRVGAKEKADKFAREKNYLQAAMNYIALGDWTSARNMAGRADGKDRAKIKYELKLKQDAINKACKDLGLKCEKSK